jgi:Fur family transcriptional regulator, ferric uptake regulator
MPPRLQTDRLFALPEAPPRFTLKIMMPDAHITPYDKLIQELRARGFRITTPRAWTLRVLSEAGGHMTSEQVFQRLHEHAIQVDEATVYRTLQWLADNRIVARTNLGLGADVFSLYDAPHHHLICLHCRAIIEIDDSVFADLRTHLLAEHGFTPQMDHFAIFGLCKQCQSEVGNQAAD